MTTDNPHIGSSFEDFLAEKGILHDAIAHAVKRVVAWQIEEPITAQGSGKGDMARHMVTSRPADGPREPRVVTRHLAAAAVGRRLVVGVG